MRRRHSRYRWTTRIQCSIHNIDATMSYTSVPSTAIPGFRVRMASTSLHYSSAGRRVPLYLHPLRSSLPSAVGWLLGTHLPATGYTFRHASRPLTLSCLDVVGACELSPLSIRSSTGFGTIVLARRASSAGIHPVLSHVQFENSGCAND